MNGLIGILAIVVLIVGLREVYCWYTKINDRMKVLEKQALLTQETNNLLRKLIAITEGEKGKHIEYVSASDGVKIELSNHK